LKELLQHFDEVFAVPMELPPQRKQDHIIPLTPGTSPTNVRPYRYPYIQKNEIEQLVKEMLEAGSIRPSVSPFSSPMLLVRKKR
jgi:hypothetical protein